MKIITAIALIAAMAMPAHAWTCESKNDPFDGESSVCYVMSDINPSDEMFAYIDEEGMRFIVTVAPGKLICTMDNHVNVSMIVDGDRKPDFEAYAGILSESMVFPKSDDLIRMIDEGDHMQLRFHDDCGQTFDFEFDISGSIPNK